MYRYEVLGIIDIVLLSFVRALAPSAPQECEMIETLTLFAIVLAVGALVWLAPEYRVRLIDAGRVRRRR